MENFNKETKIYLTVLFLICACLFIWFCSNIKSCSTISKTETVKNSHTPLINSLTKTLTKYMAKQKKDSITNSILLAKSRPIEYRYIKASNKAGLDLQNKVCDTITVRELKRASDSVYIALKAVIKSDSVVIDGLRQGQKGWVYLNSLQEKRHNRDTVIIDSLVTVAIPNEFKRGRKVGRKQGAIFGFGVSALVGTAIIVKP